MAKVIIKDSSKETINQIMNNRYLVDIEFESIIKYEEAVINGFDKEEFKKRNPGMKILINKNELWEIR